MANIVIVGANQGIGYHMAKRLLELNHSVVVLDIDISNIRQLQPRYPETLLPIVVDARRLSDIENEVKQAAGRFGSIDIAIHNACRCTFMSEPDSDYDVYRDVMDVNFFGALRLAKTVLPYMREQKEGRIIFTSSGVGVTGFENISPYAATKGAIESLAKCLEIENEEYGISEPDIKSLYVLCTLYGVSMDEFFSGVDATKLVAPVYRDEYSNAVWKNKFSRARRFP